MYIIKQNKKAMCTKQKTYQSILFRLAHIYAKNILSEFKGSYKTAFKIGLIKARFAMN